MEDVDHIAECLRMDEIVVHFCAGEDAEDFLGESMDTLDVFGPEFEELVAKLFILRITFLNKFI